MTIKMKAFGKNLVTRGTAKNVLKTLNVDEPPTLDFAGVEVANHPFMDELGKGIVAQLTKLGSQGVIKVENCNSYTAKNVAAGLKTAKAA